ncbi:precorrin-2 dehydrogenase/sirohydrochlorin ferrochelatase family protein [Paenibacillus guangzhouensis]|uniref:precorrin-2 dehydrogenase/sirohydrochlorin ferrochelatase family protein n=1 Tax=Paenibacillus guangzhouensis TaxID=1473112 RepID=UPI00187B7310|nr:bifunctional precorrin-2 dehydrogenase/sirohydrochlorin ferrochelatase [Paenibacillus guangzhouensis]
MEETSHSTYYPILMQLESMRCVVIGGGRIAERKIRGLLEAGAKVHVVSKVYTSQIDQWIAGNRITGSLRTYQSEDLAGAQLVFAATDSEEVNERVASDAHGLGILVNVASSSRSSNFVNASTLRRGKLIISVSTSGASPEMAKRIVSKLDEQYGEAYEVYLDILAELRHVIQGHIPDAGVRRQLMQRMIGMNWIEQIEQGMFPPKDSGWMERWINEQMALIEE